MVRIEFEKKILLLLISLLSFSACSQLTGAPDNRPDNSKSTPVLTPVKESAFPKPSGLVNDFANILDENDEKEIEDVLRRLQEKAKIDMAVVLIDSTAGVPVADYSLAMAREWKIGSENGGVLVFVAIRDKQWHIQVDRRLEKDLPNEEVKQIGEALIPDFKQGDYTAGIKKCVEKMIAVLAQKQHFEPIKFSARKDPKKNEK